MKGPKYRTIRPMVLIGVGILAVIVLGDLLYKEFFTPPQVPHSTPLGIVTDPPGKSDPPNGNEKRTYTVPPAHPRRMVATSIGVDALVKPINTLANGSLDAPKTAWDIGWYEKSGLPGATGTPLLLDGHVNDAINTPGVFFKLANLKSDDTITIERGDGNKMHYRVATVSQIALKDVNMAALLRPQTNAAWLVLITCGGAYDHASQTYNDRIIVTAKEVNG